MTMKTSFIPPVNPSFRTLEHTKEDPRKMGGMTSLVIVWLAVAIPSAFGQSFQPPSIPRYTPSPSIPSYSPPSTPNFEQMNQNFRQQSYNSQMNNYQMQQNFNQAQQMRDRQFGNGSR